MRPVLLCLIMNAINGSKSKQTVSNNYSTQPTRYFNSRSSMERDSLHLTTVAAALDPRNTTHIYPHHTLNFYSSASSRPASSQVTTPCSSQQRSTTPASSSVPKKWRPPKTEKEKIRDILKEMSKASFTLGTFLRLLFQQPGTGDQWIRIESAKTTITSFSKEHTPQVHLLPRLFRPCTLIHGASFTSQTQPHSESLQRTSLPIVPPLTSYPRHLLHHPSALWNPVTKGLKLGAKHLPSGRQSTLIKISSSGQYKLPARQSRRSSMLCWSRRPPPNPPAADSLWKTWASGQYPINKNISEQ